MRRSVVVVFFGVLVLGGLLALVGTAQAASPDVVVLSTSVYLSSDGQWLNIVGEVENRGDTPLRTVIVRAYYRDAAGRLIGRDAALALGMPLFPGERAPFHLLDRARPNFARYCVRTRGYTTQAEPITPLQLVSSHIYTDTEGALVLVGELENPLDVPVTRVRVPVTFYGAEGRVINVVEAQVLRDVIPAHGRSPFVARVNEGFKDVTAWRILTRYQETDETALAHDIVFSGVTPSVDARGYLVLTGQVTNRGATRATFVRVVGALYDAEGRILNASFSYPLNVHLQPGETDPFKVEFSDFDPAWDHFRVVAGAMP